MSTAKDTASRWKDGTFEIDAAPNPNAVVMEHSRTLITIFAAFIALTATFSEKLLGDQPACLQKTLFVLLWIFLLLGMLCGVFATQQLHSFLSWSAPADPPKTDAAKIAEENEASESALRAQNISACAGNIGTWMIFFAGIAAAALAVIRVMNGAAPMDANRCISVSTTYLNALPGMSSADWTLDKMEWNETKKTFDVTMESSQATKGFVLTVNAKLGVVISVKRVDLGQPTDGTVKSPTNPPTVITNLIQITVIPSPVKIPIITNFVQIPLTTNFIQLGLFTNLDERPTRVRRWGVGIGYEGKN